MDNNELILIVDDDFHYGIEKGYYPELKQDNDRIKYSTLEIISTYSPNQISQFNIGDLLIKNKYDGSYLAFNIKGVNDLIISRIIGIREVLIALGAKKISIDISQKETTKAETTFNGDINSKFSSAEASYNSKHHNLSDFKAQIKFETDFPKLNSIDDVNSIAISNGVNNDLILRTYLDHFYNKRSLENRKEKITISMDTEVDNMTKAALNIQAKLLFKLSVDYNSEFKKNKLEKFQLYVEF